MTRIATDIVLLPEDAMTDRAIEINRQLVRDYASEIVLNRRDCLPHISLAMGCIEPQDVDAIREVLERLARETPVRQLTATGIRISANSRGGRTSLLEIGKTAELQALHEGIMNEAERFFTHAATGDMFFDDAVTPTTIEWVRNYRQKAACQRFGPHITLGYGEAKPGDSFPTAFGVARLALCHLGNHNTCRRILAAVDL